MGNRLEIFSVIGLCLALSASSPAHAAKMKSLDDSELDTASVAVGTIDSGAKVVIYPFGTSNIDYGTAKNPEKVKYQALVKELTKEGPEILSNGFVKEMNEETPFKGAAKAGRGKAPGGSLVVDGKFTLMNPGNRGKRYLVGFGSGKSKVCVEGTISKAGGGAIAKFEHCKIGSIGIGGGDSEKLMKKDIRQIGEEIAAFLDEWAKGKYSK